MIDQPRMPPVSFPDLMRANQAQREESHDQALRYRMEQWRHEARLEFAKILLAAELGKPVQVDRQGNIISGNVDANSIIQTADGLAFAMYPETK